MGDHKKPNPLRYVVKKRNRYVWRPKGGTDRMRALGFRQVTLGKELTPPVIARAAEINAEWDQLRRQFPSAVGCASSSKPMSAYPPGTIGYAFNQALKLRALLRAQAGREWDKDQQKRDDWMRALRRIQAVELDRCRPAEVPTSFFLAEDKNGNPVGFLADLEREVSATERQRVLKVWRAAWNLMASNLDILGTGRLLTAPDPTAGLRFRPPQKRTAIWLYDEVVRLVEHAWVTERKGLAAIMAVAWDTMMSPIDVRKLTRAKKRRDATGAIYFALERMKTGRPGAGTLSPWSAKILGTYLDTLNVEPLEDMPLFYTPGTTPGPNGGRRYVPQPYSKKLVEEHFRAVRREVFGPNETRTLADFRRSGAVEGDAGGASIEDQANKMANRIDVNAELRRHYNPVNLASVKRYDDTRLVGRDVLREAMRTKTKQRQIANMADAKVSPGRPEKVSPLLIGRAKPLK